MKRYQLGLPVWRAFANTVQTDMLGFKYIYSGDKTAVFVDGRSRDEFQGGTVPEAVFADKPEKARTVAEEIAQKAFWNSSHFGGTFDELKQSGLW